MAIPTIDHIEAPDPGTCPCGGRTCATCATAAERAQYEADLQQWVRTFGAEPDERAPARATSA